MPSSGNMLGTIQDVLRPISDIRSDIIQQALHGLSKDPQWANRSPQEQLDEARRRTGEFEDLESTVDESLQSVKNQEQQTAELQLVGNNNIFNLSKFAQNMMPPAQPSQQQPQQSDQIFSDAAQVRDFLEQNEDLNQTLEYFMSKVENNTIVDDDLGTQLNPSQEVSDAIKQYFEGKSTDDPQTKLMLASKIFDVLPPSLKQRQNNGEDTSVMGIQEVVSDSNKAIKEAAILLANSKIKTSYNRSKMIKESQHKSFDTNMFMFGPNQVRFDPFSRNYVSDMHIVERNKGFGLAIDDVLGIDYEAIWRGSIMDKYTSPYRNEDGEYVGGYINRRFEVDRSVPEGNNYQLKPGQLRRPYVPELKSTEARLQSLRSDGKDDRGRTFVNTDKPFDWNKESDQYSSFNWKNIKEASSKKKI